MKTMRASVTVFAALSGLPTPSCLCHRQSHLAFQVVAERVDDPRRDDLPRFPAVEQHEAVDLRRLAAPAADERALVLVDAFDQHLERHADLLGGPLEADLVGDVAQALGPSATRSRGYLVGSPAAGVPSSGEYANTPT